MKWLSSLGMSSAGLSLCGVLLLENSAQQSGTRKLVELLPIWRRLRNPSLASIQIYEFAVTRFQSRFPGLSVHNIGKQHIRAYIEWLGEIGNAAKTIEKDHSAIRALLSIAVHEEWIPSNPASDALLPNRRGGRIIRSYTAAEVKAIFSSPVFVSGSRPRAGKGEAAFWVPLLMLYTGARREEICQLSTNRVLERQGIAYMVIDALGDDARLKTEHSSRVIPIHRDLIGLGFCNFVADRKRGGGGPLFPMLRPNKRGQYGAKWGDWWSRYVRICCKISDHQISPSHSFRHLFITECRRRHIRED